MYNLDDFLRKIIDLVREFQGALDDTGRYLVCGEDLTCCYDFVHFAISGSI